MSVLVMIFVFLTIKGCIWQDNYENYLVKDQTNMIKAILSIIVIFHHLSEYFEEGAINAFSHAGYVAVGCFFFFTGYGSVKQYVSKKEMYVKGFLKKKITNIIVPYMIVSALYFFYDCFKSRELLSIFDLFWRPFTVHYIASNCWYMVVLIYFYLAFYIMLLIIQECKINYKIVLLSGTLLFIIGYFVFYRYWGYIHDEVLGLHWIYSIFAIMFGVVWAIWENKVKDYLLLLSIMSFACILVISIYEAYTGDLWNIYLYNIKVVCFVILMLFFSSKIQIQNSIVLSFIGDISYEIYMIHGLVIKGLVDCGVKDVSLDEFGILTVLLAISMGAILHYGYMYVKNNCFRYLMSLQQ